MIVTGVGVRLIDRFELQIVQQVLYNYNRNVGTKALVCWRPSHWCDAFNYLRIGFKHVWNFNISNFNRFGSCLLIFSHTYTENSSIVSHPFICGEDSTFLTVDLKRDARKSIIIIIFQNGCLDRLSTHLKIYGILVCLNCLWATSWSSNGPNPPISTADVFSGRLFF